ncbi:flagellin, partial [bacterium]|nr:flagellin [bacterium]
MALTINTNISSLIAQKSMKNSTDALNRSIERMTTGFKINHAADNAAGYSIAEIWDTQLSTLDVAASNAAIGADLLTTAEENY